MRRLPALSSVVDFLTMQPRASITAVDFGSRIDFDVRYERRWRRTAAGLIFVGLAFKYAAPHHSWVYVAFALIGICGLIADWMQGSHIYLKVTAEGVEASGNLGKMFSSEIDVAGPEFESLGYELGSEDSPAGLYARRGRGGVCLVPHLSEEKCGDISSLIYKRFPDLGTGDRVSDSLLYPESSDPIRLDLFKRR